KDELPARRALAGCIVGRLGSREQREEVQRLLRDSETLVRLRAAQGLLAGEEMAGVSALIGVLDHRPVSLAWQAEELLHWVAGETAPKETVGAGATGAACRAAWERWWRERGVGLDVFRAYQSNRRPGLLFVCETSTTGP